MTSPVEIHARTILRKMRTAGLLVPRVRCGMNLYRGLRPRLRLLRRPCREVPGAGTLRLRHPGQGERRRRASPGAGASTVHQAELWPARAAGTAGSFSWAAAWATATSPSRQRCGLARSVLELFAEHAVARSRPHKVDARPARRGPHPADRAVRGGAGELQPLVGRRRDLRDLRAGSLAALGEAPRVTALRNRGINAGVFLVPVLPFLTDSAQALDESVGAAAAGAMYVLFGGMTLKPGRQKEHFLRTLTAEARSRGAMRRAVFLGRHVGKSPAGYSARVNRDFARAARRHSMPIRIPPSLAAESPGRGRDAAGVCRARSSRGGDQPQPQPRAGDETGNDAGTEEPPARDHLQHRSTGIPRGARCFGRSAARSPPTSRPVSRNALSRPRRGRRRTRPSRPPRRERFRPRRGAPRYRTRTAARAAGSHDHREDAHGDAQGQPRRFHRPARCPCRQPR